MSSYTIRTRTRVLSSPRIIAITFAPFSLQFRLHASCLYKSLCDMLYNDLKPPLRAILRRVFVRIGSVFGVADIRHR